MRTALCIGSAHCLWEDLYSLEASGLKTDGTIACNAAGYEYGGDLDAWVSLHGNKFNTWLIRRRDRGYRKAREIVAHRKWVGVTQIIDYRFPGQVNSASSGGYAAKVALMDLGFDRAILCGIPLTPTPHLADSKPWKECTNFHRAWTEIPPEYTGRIRSASGWTRDFLGGIEDWA